MNHDILNKLRDELVAAAENLKQCNSAYKGFRAFKNSPQGLTFCAEQLHKAAAALCGHAERLTTVAEDLHTTFSSTARQLELDEIAMNGQR